MEGLGLMDVIDDAQKPERLFLEECLGNRKPVGRPGQPSLTHCVDCGEEIPDRRRKAIPGCERCTGCQEDFDSQLACNVPGHG